jgi:queuine tRNA-ribosyltransferase
MSAISFKIEKKLKNSLARVGVIETNSGVINTPAFVTVGTKGTVKSLTPEMVSSLGAEVVLANTYHLYLEPGEKFVKDSGGLAKFMNWSGPTMTDSGGFQVFSLGSDYNNKIGKILDKKRELSIKPPENNLDDPLPKLVNIDEDGVMFRSHIDGSAHYFTPEKSIQIQNDLGADIIFAFDECTSPIETNYYQGKALDRTHNWAKRSLNFHRKNTISERQAIFGIVQGGRVKELREESSRFLANLDFDGFGIGGSFEKEDMKSAVFWCNSILPEDRPRHLLGIGEPEDLFMAVENGCDLFDCVSPTRIARNGNVYTRHGRVSVTNKEFRNSLNKIDEGCGCYTCKNYTVGYLAHLFRSKEMLASTLASIHNLYFIINMVKGMREAILNDNFFEYKENFLSKFYR